MPSRYVDGQQKGEKQKVKEKNPDGIYSSVTLRGAIYDGETAQDRLKSASTKPKRRS